MKRSLGLMAALTVLTAAGTDFTWDLYRQLAREDGDLFFSPYSIGTALAMTAEGARGETRSELDTLLGNTASEYETLSRSLPQWQGVKFQIANSLWPQSGFPLQPQFVTALADRFGAEAYPVDYIDAAKAAEDKINAWVAEQTLGRIPNLLSPGSLTNLTRLVLVNTIYFKGEWQRKFSEARTQKQMFYGAEQAVEMPFMNQTAQWGYAEGEKWQAVQLPYKNPAVAMLILLPKEGCPLSELEAGLDTEFLRQLDQSLASRQLKLALPKFKMRQTFDMCSVLGQLGVRAAFNPKAADFSGISPLPELYISNVVHQAEIEVDEAGTVASAATAVAVSSFAFQAEPVEFTADRPFVYMIRIVKTGAVLFIGRLQQPHGSPAAESAQMKKQELEVTGSWQFKFDGELFQVPDLTEISVIDESYRNLPVHQELGGWNDGVVLKGLEATGCSLADALVPASVVVKLTDGTLLERGKDYQFTDKWATFGRLEGGRIGPETEITVSHRYTPLRLDSLVRTAKGKLDYRTGTPASFTPALPELNDGETRLVNVYLDSLAERLTRDALFPVLQAEPVLENAQSQQAFIPKSLAKLRNGEKIKILAWGDSVTEGTYLPESERWQQQFVARLRQRYPQAEIELVSNGWGGRTIPAFLGEPAGSQYNYEETVLAVQPDLVISEFVNDACLPPEVWNDSFTKVWNDFRTRGYEWIILTPHYVRPDWMDLPSQNGESIENDPRPYVHYLRKFTAENNVALADAAKLYGQLWRCGIPYNMLMTNNINHPDGRGMKLFADALMAIFE